MATKKLLTQFNFLVTWDNMKGETKEAGFQEVNGLMVEIAMAEYRAGNFKTNEPTKVSTLAKCGDVTLKRGVMGDQDLYAWVNDVRDGKDGQGKKVTITLLDSAHKPVTNWHLTNAFPIKLTAPTLTGSGSDIAVEEITLTADRIEQEAA